MVAVHLMHCLAQVLAAYLVYYSVQVLAVHLVHCLAETLVQVLW